MLLRKLESAILEDQPIIINFIDFTKPFDSLDWNNMWKILEYQGMPDIYVNLIKKMYERSTIGIRLNMDEK